MYKYNKAVISALCDVTKGMTLLPGGSQQPRIRFSGKPSHSVLMETVKLNIVFPGNQRCEGAPLDSGMGNKDLVKRILGTPSPQFAQSTLLSDTLSENEAAALSTPPSHPRQRTRHKGTTKTGQVWKWNKQEVYIVSQTVRIETVDTSLPLFSLQQIEVTLYLLHDSHLTSLCFDRLCLSIYIKSWYMLLLHFFLTYKSINSTKVSAYTGLSHRRCYFSLF